MIRKTLQVHRLLPLSISINLKGETNALAQISAIAVYPVCYQGDLDFILQAFRTVQVQRTQCFIHAVKLIILTFLAEMH